MAKKRPTIKIESFGRYTKWNRESKELPKIVKYTTTIKSEEGNEFGMILNIVGGKGIILDYCIKHPPFKDKNGKIEPDFVGEFFIKSNNFRFFIGDCIWLPVEDKVGIWDISVSYQGKVVANKKFEIEL